MSISDYETIAKEKQTGLKNTMFSATMGINKHSQVSLNLSSTFNPSIKIEEASLIAMLNDYISVGKKFIEFIYFYRSISKILSYSKLKMDDKQKLGEETIRILHPKMAKTKEMVSYIESASEFLIQIIFQKLHSDSFIQKQILLKLCQLLDVIMTINIVLSYKVEIINDFSRYKRERIILGSEESLDMTVLQKFFGSTNYAAEFLRKKLQEKDYHKNVIFNFLDKMLYFKEEKLLSTEEDSLTLARCFLFVLYLMDGKSLNIFKSKSKVIEKVKKVYLQIEVLPLYYDCSIISRFLIHACENFKLEKHQDWMFETQQQEHIQTEMADLRNGAEALLIKLIKNTFDIDDDMKKINEETETSFKITKKWFDLILETLKIGSKIKFLMVVLNGFKLQNYISRDEITKKKQEKEEGSRSSETSIQAEDENRTSIGDLSVFEQKIRYNFSDIELGAILELIATIHKIKGIILKNERFFNECIHSYIYMAIQTFMRKQAAEFSSNKKIPDSITRDLNSIISSLADFDFSGISKSRSKKKKNLFSRKSADTNEVSVTQDKKFAIINELEVLELSSVVQRVLQLYSKKKIGMSSAVAGEWREMSYELYNFPKMANLRKLVTSLGDFSYLWLKEANLSIAGCVNFPIELSIVGMLSEYVLKKDSKVKHIFRVFDIYNDAANLALTKYKKQHIFDEVEAECSFLLDKFLYLFSKRLTQKALDYSAYELISSFEKLNGQQHANQNVSKTFMALIEVARVENYNLLGRNINIRKHVSQLVNTHVREIIEFAIHKLEVLGIKSIVEFKTAIFIFKTLISKLQKYLDIDTFDHIYSEVNESAGISNIKARVLTALSASIINDILANYNYSTKTKSFTMLRDVSDADKEKRIDRFDVTFGSKFGKSYKSIIKRDGKITSEHLKSIVEVLGSDEIVLLIDAIIFFGTEKLTKTIHPYFIKLKNAIPVVKKPPPTFGFLGAHTTYEMRLKSIDDYPPLRTNVFQALMEFGNSICLVKLFDIELKIAEILKSISLNAFIGREYTEKPFMQIYENIKDQNLEKVIYLDEAPIIFELKKHAENYKDDPVYHGSCIKIAESLQQMKREWEISENKSFLAGLLYQYTLKIYKTSFAKDFRGKFFCGPARGVDSSEDLSSICNAIKFIACNSKKTSESSHDLKTFGDGFVYSIAALIFSIDQTNRFKATDFSRYLCELERGDQKKKVIEKKNEEEILQHTENTKNFCYLAKNFESVFYCALELFKRHYQPPKRYIEIQTEKEGKKWEEDDFHERFMRQQNDI